MGAASRPPANGFVAFMRKIYNPIGFSKGYNAILWFIFAGGLFGFCLARFQYLNFSGVFCNPNGVGGNNAAPGECYAYSTKDAYKAGIQIHLYTIIPAAFLACFQFVPWIRYNVMIFHRLNIATLGICSAIGSIMIAPISFGGTLATRAWIGLSSIMFLGSMALAIYNIKMLQIEQHRAWMLRAWVYAGAIVTLRIIMIISALIISMEGVGPFHEVMKCDKLSTFFFDVESVQSAYPACVSFDSYAAVVANFNGGSENVGAALGLGFGMAAWLALAIHAIGIELYLNLTPAETERLRKVSYQRQLERGFRNPGSAGLTADRLGDSKKWTMSDPSYEEVNVGPSKMPSPRPSV